MTNELLLLATMVLLYGSVIVWYKVFGKTGLYCYLAFVTVAANIEVLILIDAFGLEQTLGNILFAATFLTTDMLSEFESREDANRAVNISIAAMVTFVVLSQLWLLYEPAAEDWASESFHVLFAMTPRITIASLIVYALVQKLDIWLYHKWWSYTTRKWGDARKRLWLRNNFSTLISQLANTILYNLLAFGGVYSGKALFEIIVAGYVIFIVTSLADTPVLYAVRRLRDSGKI